MAGFDARLMLRTPLESWPDAKKQLIDATEYTKLWPRGSTGNAIVAGSSVLYFDIPQNMVVLSSARNRFDITCVLEKKTAADEDWKKCDATDTKHVVLAENFIAHAFTSIDWQVNHMPTKTSGYVPHGQALHETFVLGHTREDAKLMCVTSDLDPAFQTYNKNSDWKVKVDNEENKWTAYAAKIFEKKYFNVNYRPNCFPFQFSAPTKGETFIVPGMGQQLTIAMTLDLPYNNVLSIHPEGYTTTQYRFSLTNIELNIGYVRFSALGERALLSNSKVLAEYPGNFVRQLPMFLTAGEKHAIFNFPEVPLPTHILLQSFSPDILTSGKPPGAAYRTRALAHNVIEVTMKFNDQVFYVSPINPGKVDDQDMKTLARRQLYEQPFFQMPCDHAIGRSEISDYSHPHLLFDLSNGGRERIQTLNAAPDEKKGKLSLHLKGDATLGLKELYMVSLIYNDCGVIIDRAQKNFVSSYFAL